MYGHDAEAGADRAILTPNLACLKQRMLPRSRPAHMAAAKNPSVPAGQTRLRTSCPPEAQDQGNMRHRVISKRRDRLMQKRLCALERPLISV